MTSNFIHEHSETWYKWFVWDKNQAIQNDDCGKPARGNSIMKIMRVGLSVLILLVKTIWLVAVGRFAKILLKNKI